MKKLVLLLLVVCFALGSAGMAMAAPADNVQLSPVSMDIIISADYAAAVAEAELLDSSVYQNKFPALSETDWRDMSRAKRYAHMVRAMIDVDGPVVQFAKEVPTPAQWELFGAAMKEVGRTWTFRTTKAGPDAASITHIPAYALKGNPYLTQVDLSNATTDIGVEAFADCPALTTVDAWEAAASSSTLTRIEAGAFKNSGLVSVIGDDFSPELQYIGESAFEGSKLAQFGERPNVVLLPVGVTEVRTRTFVGCPMTTVEMLGVTKIRANAFDGCASLVRVSHERAIDTLEAYVFANCAKLNQFGNKYMVIAWPHLVEEIAEGTFQNCASIVNVIDDSYIDKTPSTWQLEVKDVGAHAFENCTSLVGMKLSSQLGVRWNWAGNGLSFANATSVGESAFANCPGIETMILGTRARMGANVFNGDTKLNLLAFGSYRDSVTGGIQLPSSLDDFLRYAADYQLGANSLSGTAVTEGTDLTGIFVYEQSGNELLDVPHIGLHELVKKNYLVPTADERDIANVVNYMKAASDAYTNEQVASLTGVPASVVEQVAPGTPDPSDPGTTEPGTGGNGTPTKGSSSGGCDAGFGVFALALAGAVVLRKRVF